MKESEIDEEEILYLRSMIFDPDFSDDLERHMVSYTASVLQNDIFEGKWYWQLKCQQCLHAFVEDKFIEDDLLSLKMKSSKLQPLSKNTFDICMATETLMKKFAYEPINYKTIPNEVLRILHFNDLFISSNFEKHDKLDHKETLVNLIIKMYIKKRQTYISKCNTLEMRAVFLRSKLKKVVHFNGQ